MSVKDRYGKSLGQMSRLKLSISVKDVCPVMLTDQAGDFLEEGHEKMMYGWRGRLLSQGESTVRTENGRWLERGSWRWEDNVLSGRREIEQESTHTGLRSILIS